MVWSVLSLTEAVFKRTSIASTVWPFLMLLLPSINLSTLDNLFPHALVSFQHLVAFHTCLIIQGLIGSEAQNGAQAVLWHSTALFGAPIYCCRTTVI
jgi:hypothetical protein